ncbi:MAG: hypothetical protein JXA30_17545 [Deltaproteobacteria bacterium]|nr:hypothetical protein [Deltaproteobacteria bacterium]
MGETATRATRSAMWGIDTQSRFRTENLKGFGRLKSRSTNLTTYRGRYNALIEDLSRIIGRRRGVTVVDFGCGYDYKEFVPVCLTEVKQVIDPDGQRDIRIVALDQLYPYYVLDGQGINRTLVFDIEKKLIAFQSELGNLVDCQDALAPSVLLTARGDQERQAIISQRDYYHRLLLSKLSKRKKFDAEIRKKATEYKLIRDPLDKFIKQGMEFVGNASFELGIGVTVDVGISFNVLLHYEKDEIDQYLATMCRQIKEGGYLLIGETQDYYQEVVKVELVVLRKEKGAFVRDKLLFWVSPGFDQAAVELVNSNRTLFEPEHAALKRYFKTKELWESGESIGFEIFRPDRVVDRLRRELKVCAVVHNQDGVIIEFEPEGSFKKISGDFNTSRRPQASEIQEIQKRIVQWLSQNSDERDRAAIMKKLRGKLVSEYHNARLYRLPLCERMQLCRFVLRKAECKQALVAVESVYSELTRPSYGHRLPPEEPVHFIPAQTYHFLAEQLSIFESRYSIEDNQTIRFTLNALLFDVFPFGERRISELLWLVEEIEKELQQPGTGELTTHVALQDLHGGARRTLALIGFAMGLEANIYERVSDLDELKQALRERGIHVDKLPIRFAGLSDKYDRGEDPEGVFELVKWLRDEGKAKPIIGNHDFWRIISVLGVHLVPGVSMEKGEGIGYWAIEAMEHAGWGTIELDQINQRRVNAEINRVNSVLRLYDLPLLSKIDVASYRASVDQEMRRLKKLNAEIRRDNELHKDEPGYRFKDQHELPDIFSRTLAFVRTRVEERNLQIYSLNAEKGLDIRPIAYREVNFNNYMEDPDVIRRTLWDLKNFRLFFIDILGNIHLHNLLPLDFTRRVIEVQYKNRRGIRALEKMQKDIRGFFENLDDIPYSHAFRMKMWEALGEAFLEINRWFSDNKAFAKPVSVKKFVECGGPAGFGGEFLGISEKRFSDRQATFLMIIGHCERKKFDHPTTKIPWITFSARTQSGLANIDYELSEGYSDRGVILTFFKRDEEGRITGIRKWGYRAADKQVGENSSEVTSIEDMTEHDIEGMGARQVALLRYLSDGANFMQWCRYKALREIDSLLVDAIEEAGRTSRFEKEKCLEQIQRQVKEKIEKGEVVVEAKESGKKRSRRPPPQASNSGLFYVF